MNPSEIAENQITVEQAPPLEGLTFRGFRGESDYPEMVAVIQGCKEADGMDRVDTVEEVAQTYAHLSHSDPYQDMLFAEIDGQVIAYNRVSCSQEAKGDWVFTHFGFLLPEWRHLGIGQAMMNHAENRLRQIAREHPERQPRFFQSFAADTERWARERLDSSGYQAARFSFRMVRDLTEPIAFRPLPAGIEIRPVKPGHRRLIWEAEQEAFRDHWGYTPGTERDYQRWLNNPIQDPDLWKVAWEGEEVVGMVLNFINQHENEEYQRLRGYTEDISVRKPWRRKGIATALIQRSMDMLLELGMEEAALGVDVQNPTGALDLYKKLGYREEKRFTTFRKPF